MQNNNVVSKPEFHVLSNSSLDFTASLILYIGKWIKSLIETVLAFNLHFQHIGLNLQENQVNHLKESKMV
jgi:hypothetical protein